MPVKRLSRPRRELWNRVDLNEIFFNILAGPGLWETFKANHRLFAQTLGRIVTGHYDANAAKIRCENIPERLARFRTVDLKHYIVEPLHKRILQTGYTSN